METIYLINKKGTGFLLECVGGPFKTGHESIWTEDQPPLVRVLNILRVPDVKIKTVLQELRLGESATVTFDAKVMDPL